MNNTFKFLFILLANLALANPTYAKLVEQNDLQFKVQTEALLKGEIHYSFHLLTPRQLVEKFPEISELDSLSMLSAPKVKILLTKAIFIVNRPVGFYDHEHMRDEKYLAHIMGDQQIEKVAKNTFKVTVPGESGLTYKLKSYFDSDDISTLPNSRIIQGVTAARKLDVISQSASSVVFKELTAFSKYSVAGTSVTSYVPLKEERTLVITYQLTGIKKPFAIEKLLKSNFINETQAVKSLTDSFDNK